MAATKLRQRWALITGLRALLMLLAGLFAIFFTETALTLLVVVGGALLLIDGALGLWSLTFGGGKTGNFWFDVARNALALIMGILILLSPILATLVTVWFVVYIMAFQSLLVGVMEIIVVLQERELYAKIWPVLVSGISYVLFALVLFVAPLVGALVIVVFAGILMVLFAVGLFGVAWRLARREDVASV